jgi:hypothetical protein
MHNTYDIGLQCSKTLFISNTKLCMKNENFKMIDMMPHVKCNSWKELEPWHL